MEMLGSLPSAALALLFEEEMGALEGAMAESDPGV